MGEDLEGGEFEVELVRDFENKVLERRELELQVFHVGKGTPSRIELRKRVAEMLKVPLECVYVRSIRTEYGTGVSRARVHVYSDSKRALAVEPEFVIRRNAPPEGEEEAGE
mgnify:CR=1 FL=1